MIKKANNAAAKNSIQVTIKPRDPIIIRGGRPFGADGEGANRARSLNWPYPSTVAGAVRTLTGKIKAEYTSTKGSMDNPFHDIGFINRLKKIEIRGPLPIVNGMLYGPRPQDFLEYRSGYRVGLRPRPLMEGEGCNLPLPDLWTIGVPKNEKVASMPDFWSIESIVSWLAKDMKEDFVAEQVLNGFKKDARMHVKIEVGTGVSDESRFFITQGLAIPDINFQAKKSNGSNKERAALKSTQIALLIKAPDSEIGSLLTGIDTLQPLGGERRLARFCTVVPVASWECPSKIRGVLEHSKGVRMFLATPAFFENGWLPDWVDPKNLEGMPPGTEDLLLRLRGGCIGRWKAVSGWSMEKGRRGAKPIKRLVPAGSVYFFEVIKGSAGELADLWLCSTLGGGNSHSDAVQDRNDGYGLALWGTWQTNFAKGGSTT